ILCLSGAPAAAQLSWQAASRAGLDLHAGRALFDRQWVPAPASTRAASGLGPLYNARSCAACHPGGGGGASPPNAGAPAPGLVVVLGEGSRFGRQLQTAAVAGLRAEARIEVRFEESVERYADGAEVRLRWPRFDIRPLDGAELEDGLRLSPRLAPSLRGLAVLESLADTGDTGGRGEVFG